MPRTTRDAAGQPGADGHVAVAGEQRGDEGQQRGEVGGQVDVHVGEHRARRCATSTGAAPGRGPSPRGGRPRRRGGRGERPGDGPGAVGAGVVGDRDPEAEREGAVQIGVEPPDAGLEVSLLVVDGDGDVDLGSGRAHQGERHFGRAQRGVGRVPAARWCVGSECRRLGHGHSVSIATVDPVNATCGFPDNRRAPLSPAWPPVSSRFARCASSPPRRANARRRRC